MDQETFKHLVIPLQRPMQLLAEHMLGDAADAEDVVQEVFLSLWQRRSQLDSVKKLDAYCLQIVRTRCVDLLRQRNKEAQHADTIRGLTDKEVLLEVDENERLSQHLHNMMAQLPANQQELLRLKYFENCSTNQIQERLQMSPANIYTTLSRAIQSLREKIIQS